MLNTVLKPRILRIIQQQIPTRLLIAIRTQLVHSDVIRHCAPQSTCRGVEHVFKVEFHIVEAVGV